MTRYARANGSKSCNARVSADPTPWSKMVSPNKRAADSIEDDEVTTPKKEKKTPKKTPKVVKLEPGTPKTVLKSPVHLTSPLVATTSAKKIKKTPLKQKAVETPKNSNTPQAGKLSQPSPVQTRSARKKKAEINATIGTPSSKGVTPTKGTNLSTKTTPKSKTTFNKKGAKINKKEDFQLRLDDEMNSDDSDSEDLDSDDNVCMGVDSDDDLASDEEPIDAEQVERLKAELQAIINKPVSSKSILKTTKTPIKVVKTEVTETLSPAQKKQEIVSSLVDTEATGKGVPEKLAKSPQMQKTPKKKNKAQAKASPVLEKSPAKETNITEKTPVKGKAGADDAQSPAEGVISGETPSKEITDPVEVKEVSALITKTPVKTVPVKTPSKTDTALVKTPAKKDSAPVKTPAKKDSAPVKTPAKKDSAPVKTPAKKDSAPVKTPAKKDVAPVKTDAAPPAKIEEVETKIKENETVAKEPSAGDSETKNAPQDLKTSENADEVSAKDAKVLAKKLKWAQKKAQKKALKAVDSKGVVSDVNGVGDTQLAKNETLKESNGGISKSVVHDMIKHLKIGQSDRLKKKNNDATAEEERTIEVREKLLASGKTLEQIDRALPRIINTINMRLKETRCLRCRNKGHMQRDCPVSKTRPASKCYKCGDMAHNVKDCSIKEDIFTYAECFICHQIGHLTRTCPSNTKGIYPHGGGCFKCGDNTHLSKFCPGAKRSNRDENKTPEMIHKNTVVGLLDSKQSADADITDTVIEKKSFKASKQANKKQVVKF